jgi:hypothetical protein
LNLLSFLTDPEEIDDMVDAIMPAVRVAGRKLLDIMTEINQQEELFNQVAVFAKNELDAYMGQGFTREEAMALTVLSMTEIRTALSNSGKQTSSSR